MTDVLSKNNFPKSLGNLLTAAHHLGCLHLFPQKWEIFENYFVRLIGTPNQNLKYSSSSVLEFRK